MKKIILATLAVAALTASAGVAAAQQPYGQDRDGRYGQDSRYGQDGRQSHDGRYDQRTHYDRDGRYDQTRWNRDFINRRQAELDRRIDAGIRRGTLTRSEAATMRSQFRDIARLEARYRNNGLTRNERNELDRRLDGLETRLAHQTHDNEYGQGYGNRR